MAAKEMVPDAPNLTERQREILLGVVDAHVETGQPVGSKALVERIAIRVSPATVRHELAELERLGLLTHPHTSAGRVPTDRGYRYFADRVLERLEPRPQAFPLDLQSARREVDSALQATTEMLSQVARLIALVSAPAARTASVRHVEVILMQPQIVMVVVITSTGTVAKRVFAFDSAVDPGLAEWARQFMNEQLVGVTIGSHLLRRRFEEESLGTAERAFLEAIAPVFTELADEERQMFVGGTPGLLDDVRAHDLDAYRSLLELLERRRVLLDLVADALEPRRPFVRVGGEIADPALQHLALVGAAYGLANRTLGAVSLIGPARMDYEKAVALVRSAASELSRFAEEIYGDE
jgi:heat-inducible transcriptional repressor